MDILIDFIDHWEAARMTSGQIPEREGYAGLIPLDGDITTKMNVFPMYITLSTVSKSTRYL